MDGYDASKNSVESAPNLSKAESDQVGTMLAAKDGTMPGMSDGHADIVEPSRINKGKTLIALSIIGAVGIIIAIVLLVLDGMKVDYSGSYKVMKAAKEKVQILKADKYCGKVATYASVTYVKMETYMEDVEKCKETVGDVVEAMSGLPNTEGIVRNGDAEKLYQSFKTQLDAVVKDDANFIEMVDLYATWHKWIAAKDELEGWDQSDVDIQKAAEILIDSGNEDLKKYAEGWAKVKKAACTAYRAYHTADYLAKNRSELLQNMNKTQKEYADWEEKNELDIADVLKLNRGVSAKLYTAFDELYDAIKVNYEKNYNRGSGDCMETLTDIICD